MREHENKEGMFYLDSEESDYLYWLQDVNWEALAKRLGISSAALHAKRSGRYPFTASQFTKLCFLIGLKPVDVWEQRKVALRPQPYAEKKVS